MNFIHIIILSFVEGLTEFLPVSSTAHLYITSHILKIGNIQDIDTFIVSIQVGALFAGALIILKKNKITFDLVKKVSIALLPTMFIGFFLYRIVKQYLLGNLFIMALALAVGGIVIIILEKRGESKQYIEKTNLTNKDALLLGLVQSLAFIPGVSRSGALIIGGRLLNYKRHDIANFTFLLGLPTLFLASAYDIYKNKDAITASLGFDIVLGAVMSGIVAYVGIKWFLNYIQNHDFKIFGYYRIIAGIIVLLFLI